MTFPKFSLNGIIGVITKILNLLIACFLLLFGVVSLIKPDVPYNFHDQNTKISIMMIITGLAFVYTLFRPLHGGIFLILCSLVLGFIFGGFFHNPITPVVMLLGLLSFISGYLARQKLSQDTDQTQLNSI